MFLKLYNYFVRGIFIFLFIGMTVNLIINPEIIEDENDIYFFIASYITILVFYFGWGVNDTLRMYKNDDIRMYNFNCITDTIVEVITTCNTYTLLTVHLL